MATPATLTWLETYSQAGAGLSFIMEGTDTVFATDTMTGAYSGSAAPYNQWADPSTGLHVGGTIGAAIQMYAQDIQPESLDFTITDRDGVLAASLLREAYASGHRTYLTSSVVAGSTATINVQSTSGFAASGAIYIGDERIAYSGKTATTFTGISRGELAVNQADSGAEFAPSHLIGNNVTTSAVTAPSVTDYPRTWYGRWVHLLLHVRDPLTQTYNTAANAYKIFSGRIQSYRDNGDGSITITAQSAMAALNKSVGHQQWQGLFNEGITLDGTQDTLYVFSSLAASYAPTAALAFSGHYSHAKAAQTIQGQFDAWRSAGTTRASDVWSLMLIDSGDGTPRYRIRLEANATSLPIANSCGIGLHERVWNLLGWDTNTGGSKVTNSTTGDTMVDRPLKHVTDNIWEIVAPKPPIIYAERNLGTYIPFEVSSQSGTFVTQTVSDIDTVLSAPTGEVNGVVQINGGPFDQVVYAVMYTAGSPTATLKVYAQLDPESGQFRVAGNPVEVQNGYVRLGDARQPPSVKQVWFEHGPAGTALLKAILSTGGASGYNHSDYDVRTTVGFGAGIPASLIDVPSFEGLNDAQLMILIDEPKPVYELLEPVLQATNRYVVWRAADASSQPKLTIVRPTLDNSTKLVWQLTESNKAGALSGPDRVKIERGAEGIINRVVVKYGHGVDGDEAKAKTWILEDIASQSDYGRRREITLKAPGVTNVEQLAPSTIAPAMAYFSRPLAIAERSYNASCIRMAPGDAVSVTDNYLVDPTTGIRGAVIYGWVLDCKFDLATGMGRCRIVFLPEKLPRVMKWAPSARVDEGSANAGYDVATKTLSTRTHEYSSSSESADALNFVNGDVVHVYALDEASPLEWYDVVNGGTGTNSIPLTTGLAGWSTSKRYVVELADVTNVSTARRNECAFIADDADLSTGGTPSTAYDWGVSEVLSGTSSAAIVYTQGMFQPSTTGSDKGEPMSVHKQTNLVHAANNFHSYKSREVFINQWLESAGAVTGTTPGLVYIHAIPIYMHRSRGLRVRLYIKTSSGTGTFKVRSSTDVPRGSSFTSFIVNGATSVTTTTTSTSPVWSAELSLSVSPAPFLTGVEGLVGTYITVEASGSGGGVTATLQAISVWEAEI